ncbi:MAG: hypothetical protein K2H47_08760 [Muribaculaceae bacterium]|nr:hypothetical protein [Muribaculaceae bacterium]
MDKLLRLFAGITLVILPALCTAAGLVPEHCYLESGTLGGTFDHPLDGPLNMFTLSFDGKIELTDKAQAYVICDGKEIARAVSFKTDNYIGPNRTQGWVYINFSGEYLPLGKAYKLYVAPGSIRLSEDLTVTNDELLLTFRVPADLGEPNFSPFYNGCQIISEQCISCTLGLEALPVGNPEWELYREGELMRTYPADINSDWNLGSAFLDFGEKLHFEKGVNYRIILRAGSACGRREDLLSREAVLDFVGGYEEPLQHPSYYRCSYFDEHPAVINEVSFYYSSPIMLIRDKPIYLVEIVYNNSEATYNILSETIPTLTQEGEDWVLKADFGGIVPKSGKGFSFLIPEGTIVNAEGD